MQISISPANKNDVLGIQKLFYATWVETYPNEEAGITKKDVEDHFEGAFSDETLARVAKRIQELPSTAKFFVAKNRTDGQVVGVCRITLHPDRNQLQAIYVLPQFQQKGVGRQLWDEAVKFFDKSKPVVVDVATYNIKAIKFYEKLGFTDTGERFTEERHKMKNGAYIPEMRMILNLDRKTAQSYD